MDINNIDINDLDFVKDPIEKQNLINMHEITQILTALKGAKTKRELLAVRKQVTETLDRLSGSAPLFVQNGKCIYGYENMVDIKNLVMFDETTHWVSKAHFFCTSYKQFLFDHNKSTLEVMAIIALFYVKIVLELLKDGYFDKLYLVLADYLDGDADYTELKIGNKAWEESPEIINKVRFEEQQNVDLFFNMFDYVTQALTGDNDGFIYITNKDAESDINSADVYWGEDIYYRTKDNYEQILATILKNFGLTKDERSCFGNFVTTITNKVGNGKDNWNTVNFMTYMQNIHPLFIKTARAWLLVALAQGLSLSDVYDKYK